MIITKRTTPSSGNRVVIFDSEDDLANGLNTGTFQEPWGVAAKGGKFVWAAENPAGRFVSEEAQAVLDRMTGLTKVEEDAIINFVNQEVSVGNYAKYDEFFAFGLSGTNALTGFKSKTATNNGTVLSVEGAQTDGATTYIDTNFNPSVDAVNYGLDAGQMEGYVKDLVRDGTGRVPFGCQDGTNVALFTNTGVSFDNRFSLNNSGTPSPTLNNSDIELMSVERINNATMNLLINGVQVAQSSSTATAIPSNTIFVGGRNSGALNAPANGLFSTFYIGGRIPDQSAHYTNLLQFLIDLGTFSQPVLDRFTGLDAKAEESIAKFVNNEVLQGNWQKYDEFFFFPLGATNGLIGFKDKTATNNGATFGAEGATFAGASQRIVSNFDAAIDGVNYTVGEASLEVFAVRTEATGNIRQMLSSGSNLQLANRANIAPDQSLYARMNQSSGMFATAANNYELLMGQVSAGNLSVHINGSQAATRTITPSAIVSGAISIGSNSSNLENYNGTLSTALIGGALPNQSAHYNNLLQLLIDFDVFAGPVIASFPQPLGAGEADRIRAFINAEVVAGNWQKMDSFFDFTLSDPANALWDWVRKVSATAVNAPTHGANGFTFDGATQYLDSGFNPSTDGVSYQLNDSSVSIYLHDNTDTLNNIQDAFGTSDGILRANVQNVTDRIRVSLNTATLQSFTGTILDYPNYFYFERTGATALEGFKNGVSIGAGVIASSGLSNGDIRIGLGSTPYYSGTISTFMAGGVLADQAQHNSNVRTLLGL